MTRPYLRVHSQFLAIILGIPKVELSVPEFFVIPGLGQLFAIKGNFSHGWMGEVSKDRPEDPGIFLQKTYLHQASFYGRFGKPSWNLKVYGGFNHQVLWGSEQEYYSGPYFNDDFTLSPITTYYYIITGKRFDNGVIQETRLGDHLGSIDIGFEYDFEKVNILFYRQNIYEAGALFYLANIQDGLNGVRLINKQNNGKSGFWRKVLFEFLYTKNHAGEPWSPSTPSPYEDYYNHGQYVNGWSYNGRAIGTPFISTRTDTREELAAYPGEYFINNRLYAFHIGFEGAMKNLSYILKASWSRNYGTYWTTDQEQSTGIPNPGAFGIFGIQEQLSTFLELHTELNNGLDLGCVTAFDIGDLYYNSFGVFLKVSKSF